MILKENNINKILLVFLFSHLLIWTLIPSLVNTNLPLDTIEALTWGNELQLGYDKYPPIFPLFTELFYFIFGNQDWAYYLLSQLFVVSAFFIIFKFSENIFEKKSYSLISVLLLEGIYFYNFTTPELNAFLCQFPFLAATVFYSWESINKNKQSSWILFGIFAGLATLTYYLSLYLLASLGLFFIYLIIIEKKFNYNYLLALSVFFIILSPHLIWIFNNNFSSINYALFRSFGDPLSGFEGPKFIDHILYPVIFLIKQIIIFLPFFLMLFFTIKKTKIKINYHDKKIIFLIAITFLPVLLMLLTSLFSGARIRTMWMTSFYLFTGVFATYLYQKQIYLKYLKKFTLSFLFLFILSPILYFLVSHIETEKRTDYPGKLISEKIQKEWNKNFSNNIEVVVGEGWINGGWYAGNLSYHLSTRPFVRRELKNKAFKGIILIRGFNEIKDCKGHKFQIVNFNDVCMVGNK